MYLLQIDENGRHFLLQCCVACVLMEVHCLIPSGEQTGHCLNLDMLFSACRMSCHWLVGKCPTVRFYVASPLIAANQHRIGTL